MREYFIIYSLLTASAAGSLLLLQVELREATADI